MVSLGFTHNSSFNATITTGRRWCVTIDMNEYVLFAFLLSGCTLYKR